ncbi:DUF3592 domain-containing protein [bacterium]|nr:DUF3592 domain-containing protein [bacterium]
MEPQLNSKESSAKETHLIKYTGILVFLIFSGIGFILLRQAVNARRMGKLAQKWPSTTATVLESGVEEDPARNAMGNVNLAYRVWVRYEYTVEEKVLQGDRVSFGRPSFDYVSASNIQDQFAQGKQVPVWYNPEKHEEAVLAPKTTVGMLSRIPGIFLIITGVVIGLVSVLF